MSGGLLLRASASSAPDGMARASNHLFVAGEVLPTWARRQRLAPAPLGVFVAEGVTEVISSCS